MDSKTLEHDYARAQWGSVRSAQKIVDMAPDLIKMCERNMRRSDSIDRACNWFCAGLGFGLALIIMGVWP